MKKIFPYFIVLLVIVSVIGFVISCTDIGNIGNNSSDFGSTIFDDDTESNTEISSETESESITIEDESSVNSEESSDTDFVPADFSSITINCLGDSLTYGANPDGSQMVYPFPKLLKEELGCSVVNNYGIGGTKIANEGDSSFTVRYNEMTDADIIVVMGGTNDALSFSLDMAYRTPLGNVNDMSEKTFYGALNSLCYKLKNKYPNSLIVFVTPLPIADSITEWTTASGSFSVEEAGIAMKTVCAKFNIPVFDAYNLTGYGAICNEDKLSGTGDGIHPSQEFWASDFTPKLAEFIRVNYK